jgi:hypothetical protein
VDKIGDRPFRIGKATTLKIFSLPNEQQPGFLTGSSPGPPIFGTLSTRDCLTRQLAHSFSPTSLKYERDYDEQSRREYPASHIRSPCQISAWFIGDNPFEIITAETPTSARIFRPSNRNQRIARCLRKCFIRAGAILLNVSIGQVWRRLVIFLARR